MKLFFTLSTVCALYLTMVMFAHADEPEIRVPSKEDRAISCEVHCAYAEMGNEYAIRIINLIPCDCGFNYDNKESTCKERR